MDQQLAHQPDSFIRAAALDNLGQALSALGFEISARFSVARPEPEDHFHPGCRISYRKAGWMFEQASESSGLEHFGLLLGQRLAPAHLGIVGHLATTAPNVLTSLRSMVRHFDLHDRGGLLRLDTASRQTSFGYAISTPDVPATEQIYDFSVAGICALMRAWCGPGWTPAKVRLARARPADIRPYKDYFQAPVEFDAPNSEVIFSSRWLENSSRQADAASHRRLLENAAQMHEILPLPLSSRVKTILCRELPTVQRAGTVADLLGIHERTLHRRLREEDTSYRQVLDRLRRHASLCYLQTTALPTRDIARALGYGTTAAFDHAFLRWFGVPPRHWRLNPPREQCRAAPQRFLGRNTNIGGEYER